MPSRPLVAVLAALTALPACHDFALPPVVEEPLPPQISGLRTVPAALAGAGVAIEAFSGQNLYLEGANLAAGGTETPVVTVAGAQARVVQAADTLVEVEVPAGLAKGEAEVRLRTSVQEVGAVDRLVVLGTGHLAGRGDAGRARYYSWPHSAALGPRHAAYVDLGLSRAVVTSRGPEAASSRYFLLAVKDQGMLVDLVMPLEVAASPDGFFVRVLAGPGPSGDYSSAVTYLTPDQELPFASVPCLPGDSCGAWVGIPPARGAGKLAWSRALGSAVWLDLQPGSPSSASLYLDVTPAAPDPVLRRVSLGFDVAQRGYPVAFAAADPDGPRPGRLSVVALVSETSCAVYDWTWTLAGGQAQLSPGFAVRTLPSVGPCGASDADFDSLGRLVVLDARGAIAREHGEGFETLELPVPDPANGAPLSLAAAADQALLVGTATGILRVGGADLPGPATGADAGGVAPIEGFLATATPPGRLAREVDSWTEFAAVWQRMDPADLRAGQELSVVDARGPTLLAEATSSYSFHGLAYLEQKGALVSLSPELVDVVAGDLSTGLVAPMPEVSRSLPGLRGWTLDGDRLAVAVEMNEAPAGRTRASVAVVSFAAEGADAGTAHVEEISVPDVDGDKPLGIAVWRDGYVVARRQRAQLVPSSAAADGGTVTSVAYASSPSIPEELTPPCAADAGVGDAGCPSAPAYGALAALASDPLRGVVYLPAADGAPDLDAPAAEATALAEVALSGEDRGQTRWELKLPGDRLVFGLSLSRRGDVLAVAASPAAAQFGRGGEYADAFVVRRDAQTDAWGPWCRLGRDAVTAVALAPDGARLYVGVAGGRVFEVSSFACPGAGRVLAADPVPYAILGDLFTAVTALAPSQDGTRLGYVLQGRTASFGFLQ